MVTASLTGNARHIKLSHFKFIHNYADMTKCTGCIVHISTQIKQSAAVLFVNQLDQVASVIMFCIVLCRSVVLMTSSNSHIKLHKHTHTHTHTLYITIPAFLPAHASQPRYLDYVCHIHPAIRGSFSIHYYVLKHHRETFRRSLHGQNRRGSLQAD